MVRWTDEVSQSFERHLARSSRKLKAGMSARNRRIGDVVLRSGVDSTVGCCLAGDCGVVGIEVVLQDVHVF